MDPTTTAIGTWSGGRFMHFGEPLEDERLLALLAPGDGIDTVISADAYGAGEADSMLGRALQGCAREDYCLIGAVGHDFYTGQREGAKGFPRFTDPRLRGERDYASYIRMAAERSLQRLGAERFDLLLLHNPDRTGYSSPAVWEGMRAVRDEGLTRQLGVAPGPANGFTLDLIDCFERFSELIDWAMIILNPLEPWPGELALEAAATHDVRLIARVVDYGGVFHDDVEPGHRFAEYDHRKFRPDGWVEQGRAKLELMRPIAERHGLSMLQLACAWNLAHAQVECVAPTLIQESGPGARPVEDKRAELATVRRAVSAQRAGGGADRCDRREPWLHGAEGREPRTRGRRAGGPLGVGRAARSARRALADRARERLGQANPLSAALPRRQTQMSIDVSGIKEGQRRMWTAGDYPDLARTIEGVAELVVERAGAGPGETLLDVATGSGNVAIPAALGGAQVTGLDLTPKLLEAARGRAASAGLEIRFVEGDAEELPFDADSFDRVTSCFGVMFAPRQPVAAAELVRVAKPGARIVFTAWTPEGLNGRMFKTVGSYMPPVSPELEPPVMWGDEDHVRELFADSGAELAFERHTVTFEHESPEGWLDYNERVLGPTVLAKSSARAGGRWSALRSELLQLYIDANEAEDGSMRVRAEYLLSVAQLPG